MEIISVGKRLRLIRKQLNIRQDEITGNEITRNLISIIENDKTNMTAKVAEILSREINAICVERSLDFHISAEALMESEERLCERLALGLIEEIEVATLDFFSFENQNRIMSMDIHLRFYKLFNLSLKLLTLSESVVGNHDIELGYMFSKRVVELSDYVKDDLANISYAINLSYYAINLSKFEEARLVCRVTLRKYKEISSTDLFTLLMNLNIAAIKLNDTATSEEAIEAMLKIRGLSLLEKNKVLISQANRKYLDGKFEEAKFYYRDLLNNTAIDETYLVYSNLLDIYRITESSDLSSFIEEVVKFNSEDLEKDSIYLCKFYWKLSMAYRALEDKHSYLANLQSALALKEDARINSEVKQIIIETIEYLEKTRDMDVEALLISQVIEHAKNKKLKTDDKVSWKITEYLLSKMRCQEALSFVQIMQQ